MQILAAIDYAKPRRMLADVVDSIDALRCVLQDAEILSVSGRGLNSQHPMIRLLVGATVKSTTGHKDVYAIELSTKIWLKAAGGELLAESDFDSSQNCFICCTVDAVVLSGGVALMSSGRYIRLFGGGHDT